ncbi:MAG TPA: HPP family protein [Planctomycetes bacterium]|nr:HPP family protein [Planctomycetota bacterium]
MQVWEKFKRLWKHYIFQSLLASLSILVLVLTVGENKVVIIASMAATAFICFAMPTSVSAQTKNVIGGHIAGLVCGALLTLTALPYYAEFPLAVGLTILLMVALDFEHAPAAGTALAVTINEVTLTVAVIVIISAILLTQCRYYARNILKDLI